MRYDDSTGIRTSRDESRPSSAVASISMRWSNVPVIFRREVRDQVRDRRTLFMIFVLPILLYPLLGIGMLQFAAALEQKPRVVVVVGAEYLPESPPLLNAERRRVQPRACSTRPPRPSGWSCGWSRACGPWGDPARREQAIRPGRGLGAVMVDPARPAPSSSSASKTIDIPIKYNSVDEPSQITYFRLKELLERWKTRIVAGPAQARSEDRELHRADPGQGRGRGNRPARWARASGAGCSRSCWS